MEGIYSLLGVVIGALLIWFQGWWFEHRSMKKHASYLAIHVVCILDRFIEDCVSVVGDDGLCHGQRDQDGYCSIQVKAPDVPSYPDDIDWKSIPQDMMYKILGFSNEILSAHNRVSAVFEHVADPPDSYEGFEERHFQYSNLGLLAFEYASELRVKYEIPLPVYGDWNPIDYLRDKNSKIKQRREAQLPWTLP